MKATPAGGTCAAPTEADTLAAANPLAIPNHRRTLAPELAVSQIRLQ